jgi:chemotaxis methyl-accepting protein methylase
MIEAQDPPTPDRFRHILLRGASSCASHVERRALVKSRRDRTQDRGAWADHLETGHIQSPARDERLDVFIGWVLHKAGLDPTAYRPRPLNRRLSACLRSLKVRTPLQARELLEGRPELLSTAVSALLIGVTSFMRDDIVFETLRNEVLPGIAQHPGRLRVWSAACANGAELCSAALLFAEAGLLGRTVFLGTDCRADAIQRASSGRYQGKEVESLPSSLRQRYLEPSGDANRLVHPVRQALNWKVADITASVERGPWDLIFFRNAAIYMDGGVSQRIHAELVEQLRPGGVLVTGRAERPALPGLTRLGRCIYRACERQP